MGWLSVTTLLTAVFILYISHAMYNMYQLFTPALCETNSKNCLLPYFESDAFGIFTPVQLRVYVSTKSNDIGKLVSTTSNFQLSESRKIQVNVTLPRTTLKNGTLYAHCFLLPNEYLKDSPTSAPWKVHQSSILTFYQIPVAEKFSLVGGDNSSDVSESHSKKQKDQPVTHLRSVLPLTSSYEAPYFAKDQLPSELRQFIGLHGSSQRYLPIFYLNRLGFRNKDLVEVVETKPEATLTINYEPISIGKLRLLVTTYYSLEQMKDLGFTEKDLDEVKGVFVDTNLYLLAVTVFVSSIHILFDTLSFKNDIHFWRNRKTMVGLSTKALLWRCFSGTVIFFYLLDQDTSLLVLIPSGISTLIEYWKVTKAFKISFSFSSGMKFGSQSDAEAETDAFDGQAMKWLSVLLIPLCIGGAIYSLAYVPHKSWRSWGLQSAANGVYAFGFLFMLPQLFVNYKLKSVAHLPWRAFMYKAFNTFIDDLFAFIITMPTAHRLACFRDDIVFLVYLYQRYLYPVDHTRVNEFGESGEDAEVAKEEDAKKND